MVPDEDVVHLLNSANGGDDIGFDLLLGKGVRRETGSEGNEGLAGGLPVYENDLLGYIRRKIRSFKRAFNGMGGLGYGCRWKRNRKKRTVQLNGRGKRSFAADAGAFALALEGDVEVVVRARAWIRGGSGEVREG